MLQARIIPCLLLQGTGLVKTVKFKNPTYLGDATNAVRIFNKKDVDELIFLDTMATNEKKIPLISAIQKISDECYMPLAVGGGIKKLEDIQELIQAGAEKVIINSFAAEHPEFLKEASLKFGSQSIVASIDVKKTKNRYEVFTHSGTRPTGAHPVNLAKIYQQNGAGEIMINSIDRDGMMQGFDLKLIKILTGSVSIPVIACGGAGKLSDFYQAVQAGASAVAAGSFFVFYGPRKAVLISFPTKKEMEDIFKK